MSTATDSRFELGARQRKTLDSGPRIFTYCHRLWSGTRVGSKRGMAAQTYEVTGPPGSAILSWSALADDIRNLAQLPRGDGDTDVES